jgi:muramoyltetrapeptide carboxypeptidase
MVSVGSPRLNKEVSVIHLMFPLIAVCLGAGEPATEEMPWLKARGLKPGDTIALIAPAGPAELTPLRKYAALLEKDGYQVLLPAGGERKVGYLGGSDDQRAEEFNAALRDPKIRAIMPVRGGFGLTRILDQIDYAALREDPKIVTGFSDLTAFHLAAARKARVVTFHSPMPMHELWNEAKPYAFAAASFRRAIFAASYPKGETGYVVAMPDDQPAPVKLVGGIARGRLVGGNLTLICSTLGTPYQIEAKGNLLFLEDTNEAPYRIDRSLSQLRLAGVLDDVSGVILGEFTAKNAEEAKDIDRVLHEYFGKAKVPVLMNFPIGHQPHNATLPLGASAELESGKGTLRLLENSVRLE